MDPNPTEAYTEEELDTFVESLRHHGHVFPLWLAFAGIVGLIASAALVVEKISYWTQKANGDAPILGCNINPIIGCGNVINTAPASIFWSLPNPIVGVVAFSIVTTIAVMLIARVVLPTWFWIGLQAGAVFGLAIVTYLQYESLYNIGALCPFCMVIWSAMIPTFWAITARNVSAWAPLSFAASFLRTYLPLVIILHFAVLIALILVQFGSRLWA